MTVAHVEALRLENHFLRQSLYEKKNDDKEIAEMQKKYHHVLDLNQKENRRMKSEVIQLSEYIEAIKTSQGAKNLKSTTSKEDLTQLNDELNIRFDFKFKLKSIPILVFLYFAFFSRRAKAAKDEYEKQIEMIKKQHELSVKRLNNEIEKLYSEKQALQLELENKLQANSTALQHSQVYQMNEFRDNMAINKSNNSGKNLIENFQTFLFLNKNFPL